MWGDQSLTSIISTITLKSTMIIMCVWLLYILEEFHSVSFFQVRPYVGEASVIDRPLCKDGKQSSEHDDDLEHIGPHHSLHSALQW